MSSHLHAHHALDPRSPTYPMTVRTYAHARAIEVLWRVTYPRSSAVTSAGRVSNNKLLA
jgi:hypothetical protein